MTAVFSLTEKLRRRLWYMLGVGLVVRLLAMALLPLMDTTEARYAEIARKMLETGDWITLQHDYGIPFWAKPPLSSWLSAASMDWFGINAFAVRLPSLCLALVMLGMIWYLGNRQRNRDFGFFSAAILFSFPLFYIAAGAVMTDMAMAFSVCLSFVAFWLAITEKNRRRGQLCGYLFFVGQGLGLLAKGPICGVMTVFPILFWMVGKGPDWHILWRRLPWIWGSLLMLLIAAPWYLLAEIKTPGFLDYFIIGEHFNRFLVSGWKGDLYGHAHRAPLGTIWLFWITAILPWSVLVVGWLLSRFKSLRSLLNDRDGWAWYLFCWALWPMLFFTLAQNIIWPYVITGLPACALLLAEIWHRGRVVKSAATGLSYRHWLWVPFTLSALVVAGMVMVSNKPGSWQTQRYLAQEYLDRRPSPDSEFYYLFRRYASAEFYTYGRAHYSEDPRIVKELLNNDTQDFIAINERAIRKAPAELSAGFTKINTTHGVALFIENGAFPVDKATMDVGATQ